MQTSVLKTLLRDLVIVACLALASLACGWGVNHLRGGFRAAEATNRVDQGSAFAAAQVREVELADAKRLSENPGEGLILDARPEVFYRQGHIPGALSLAQIDFEFSYEKLQPVLERNRLLPILVYCSSQECPDSQKVADVLVEKGYRQVLVFRGGLREWKQANLPVEKVQ